MTVLDLRAEQKNPPRARDGRITSATTGYAHRKVARERDPRDVDSIVLHQTACTFGPDDAAKRHRRALGIAAHATVFRDGTLVLAAPVSWYMNHGNGLNARSIGLEVEGHYAGVADDPETPRREDLASTWQSHEPTPLTDETIAAAREGIRVLVEEARAWGATIRYVLAHRQSSATRRSDPGELLWRAVVLEYAVPALGLATDPKLVVGDGRPVPREWDPAGAGKY